MSAGLTPVGVQANNGPIIYTAGLWTPATTGTFPDSYVHGAPAYDSASTEKAVMVLWAPRAWPSVTVTIVGLAAAFGSGTVRLQFADEANDFVDISVAGAYVGPLTFPTGPSWSAGSGVLSAWQFVQYPISRVGGHANDTLNGEDFGILSVAVSNGG